MSTHHETTTLAGRAVDVLTAEDAGVRLTVARLGAEPVSLARRDASAGGGWRGFLWRDGDLLKAASGWNNHATVMGYYLHRLVNERSLLRGREIRGGTHSFLRHKEFAAPEFDGGAASLTYTMPADGFAAQEYPLRVSLRLTYTLEADGALAVSFRFTNEEPAETAPVSFGLHPGFAVGSMADCAVLLPPGRYRRLLAPGNFLSGETVEIDHTGGPMPFAKTDLPGSFLLDLAGVPDRRFTLEDPVGGRRVTLNCPQAPFLTLWSDGHDFVCLEPCWGLPDHAEQRPFEEKLGIEPIAPGGGTLAREFRVHAELMPPSAHAPSDV